MQELKAILPKYISTDIDELRTPADTARFIKGLRISGTKNANLNTGTGDGSDTGSNLLVQASTPSNINIGSPPDLPGVNATIGGGEFLEVNKLFYCNYNSNGNHGIYMVDTVTLKTDKVIVDAELNFSLEPEHAIPAHRMALKVVYTSGDISTRQVKEMYLIFTDGKEWQRYISVLAAVKTDGFNVSLFPYWNVHVPHYDRAELIDYPTRPPMFCPIVTEIPPTADDAGKKNTLIDSSVQFSYAFQLTDGRFTTPSPYSNPYTLETQGCDINKTNLPRCLNLKLYAGSPLVERIVIYRRLCNSDFVLYDIINKYSSCDNNAPDKIGDEYWKRTDAWSGLSYNANDNTITYKYCGDKGCSTFAQEDVMRFHNDIPIQSFAVTAAGDSIIFANNKYFYDQIPCESTKNISITLKPGDSGNACVTANRKIRLYSFISRGGFSNCFAYRKDEGDETIRFGGVEATPNIFDDDIYYDVDIKHSEVDRFNLTFNERHGFICYLRGTPYFAIGQQYKVDRNGKKEFVGIIDTWIASQMDFVEEWFEDGGYFIMQYDFVVPAGKYIATLARHNADATGDYASTSTYIAGIASSFNKHPTYPNIPYTSMNSYAKEIEIDVCNSDYDRWGNAGDLFYIYAPYEYKVDLNERWRFIEGYVKEERNSTKGVELLRYVATDGDPDYYRGGEYTDHNGFFFQFTARGNAKQSDVVFIGKVNCVMMPEAFETSGLPANRRGYYPDTDVYVADKLGGEFGKHNRILIRGKITKCGTTEGVSGVAVTLSRGETTYTSSDGTFELIAHNSFEGTRIDRLYINAVGACIFSGCNCECHSYIVYNDSVVPCNVGFERVYPVSIERQYKLFSGKQKALRGGGRYIIGMAGYDLAGRPTYISPVKTIDYPTFIERGNYNPSIIEWNITGALNLNKAIRYVSFFRTDNLNFGENLQWVGDKIEYLDIKGNVISSTSGAVRARITIQSLNDYNIENKFSSTTKWSFVSGDRLRIYDDGDGNLLSLSDTQGFMDYQILGTNWEDTGVQGSDEPVDDGKSFIIPFDKRLERLKDKCGFWIDIVRPRDCQLDNFFFEICGMYPVKNGELLNGVQGGILNTWDTYYLQRTFQIEGCGGKAYLHPFESNNISDFYGEKCSSNGRNHIRDDRITQRWYPDDFIRSDEYVNEGGYNGLGMFRSSNRKQFKGQEGGGIVALNAERNVIFVVTQNDWFLLDYNMNIVRVTSTGAVVANLNETLSDPHQKIGMNYGCEYEHTKTILFFDGRASWANAANSGWVLSDYSSARLISDIDNKNYFIDKFRAILQFNSELSESRYISNLFDVLSGYDVNNKELHVTFRPRRNMNTAPESFVNDLRGRYMLHQETFIFNIEMERWVRHGGHTPEFYSTIRGSASGSELVAFAAGKPYYHNHKNAIGFNTYFGIKTEMVIAIRKSEEVVSIFQSWLINSNNQLWFIDEAYTNEAASLSYVPPAYIKFSEGVHYAELLRDMNSYPNVSELWRSMLIDGKRIFGKYLNARFVADPKRIGEYTEVKDILVRTSVS